jgi:hypothetical protein
MSMGKNFLAPRNVSLWLAFSLASTLLSCRGTQELNPVSKKELPQELSLKEDRSQFAELRKDIPIEIQSKNDEAALILELMKDPSEEPNRIRERFQTQLRKQRESNDKQLRELREEFTKEERNRRENFTKKLKEEREAFISSKPKSDARNTFFSDQESRRRNFFSTERETREEFESKVRENRKNFDDKARELNGKFELEYRAFSKKHQEYLKEKKSAPAVELIRRPVTPAVNAPATVNNPDLSEFDKIPKGQKIQLAPASEE